MQARPPGGFHISGAVTLSENLVWSKKAASGARGQMALRGFPELADAHLRQPCRNYARNRFG
jgi:hypothetical protein